MAAIRLIGSNLNHLTHTGSDGTERPTTVLAITHNLELIKGWSHVGLFFEGALAEYGTPRVLKVRRGMYYQMISRIESLTFDDDGQPHISAWRLQSVWMLSLVPDVLLADIAKQFKTRMIGQGRMMVEQGARCDSMLVLARGAVIEFTEAVKDDPSKHSLWEMGDAGGEEGLVADLTDGSDNGFWRVSLTARTPTVTFLELTRVVFNKMLEANMELKDAVQQAVAMVEHARSVARVRDLWPFALVPEEKVHKLQLLLHPMVSVTRVDSFKHTRVTKLTNAIHAHSRGYKHTPAATEGVPRQ
jgi:hypothetical protein